MEDLISRDALLEFARNHVGGTVDCNDIARFPAIDAVEVVRCGECIHATRSPWGHPTLKWCPMQDMHKRPDWFCADGRRAK